MKHHYRGPTEGEPGDKKESSSKPTAMDPQCLWLNLTEVNFLSNGHETELIQCT
jgi:hypothetical protein